MGRKASIPSRLALDLYADLVFFALTLNLCYTSGKSTLQFFNSARQISNMMVKFYRVSAYVNFDGVVQLIGWQCGSVVKTSVFGLSLIYACSIIDR